jgi:hypothetical protein
MTSNVTTVASRRRTSNAVPDLEAVAIKRTPGERVFDRLNAQRSRETVIRWPQKIWRFNYTPSWQAVLLATKSNPHGSDYTVLLAVAS